MERHKLVIAQIPLPRATNSSNKGRQLAFYDSILDKEGPYIPAK